MTSCLTESDFNDTMLQATKQRGPESLSVFQHLLAAFGKNSIEARRVGKRLDQRYKKALADLDCLRTPATIARYWNQKVQRGQAQDAYWAVITHPQTDEALRIKATQEMQIRTMRIRLDAHSKEQELTALRKELSTTRTQAYDRIIQLEAQLRTAARQSTTPSHPKHFSSTQDNETIRKLQNRLETVEKLNHTQAEKIKDLIAQCQAYESKHVTPSEPHDHISLAQPLQSSHPSGFKNGLKTVLKTARTHYAF